MHLNVTVTEFARNLAEYLNRVAHRSEKFVLMRGNKAVAELRPMPSGRRLGDLPQMLESLPRLDEEEAASFAADIEQARRELGPAEVRDPWES